MSHRDQGEDSPLALKHANVFLLIASVSFILFLLITTAVLTSTFFQRIDEQLLDYFGNFQRQAPDWLVTISTWFQNGSSAGLGILSSLLILFWLISGRTRRFFLMLSTVGGIELLWLALLFAIGRERPEQVTVWGGVNLPSYPSGHAMFNVAFYGGLLYIFYHQIPAGLRRHVVLGCIGLLLLLTGLNRLFFSVHYFSDVIGGYVFGIAWTAFSLWMVEHSWAKWGKSAQKRS